MSEKKAAVLIAFMILIVTAARLAVFLSVAGRLPDHFQTGDSPGYISSAMALVTSGRFLESPAPNAQPEWSRTPGYPLFLSSIFFLWKQNLTAVGVIQILIGAFSMSLTAWLAYKITRSSPIAIIATILYALDLPTFLHTQLVLTETLFTFFVILIGCVCCLWLSTRLRSRQNLYALICGLLIGMAAWIRPIACYLPILLLGGLWLMTILNKVSWKASLAATGLLVIPWLILVGGWQIRNNQVVGCPEFTKIAGVNLLYYRGAGIVAQRDQISFQEAQNRLRTQAASLPKTDACGPEKALAAQLILKNPRLFAIDEIKGLANFLLDSNGGDFLLYLGEYYSSSPLGDIRSLPFPEFIQRWVVQHPFSLIIYIYAKLYVLLIYTLIFLGGIAFINEIRKRHPKAGSSVLFDPKSILLLAGSCAYFALLSAGPEAYARFRVPIMPFLSILAACGLDALWTGLRTRHRKEIG